MPEYKSGDMWDDFGKVDHFLITTNSTIKKNGAVVMGAGIAKVVRDQWPGIDVKMGKKIINICDSKGYYGIIFGKRIGMFQVKTFWGDKADAALIEASTIMLREHAESHTTHQYALNMPGIGNGGLPLAVVKPITDKLPNNVRVWSYN